ncbi:MAG: alpha/beta fold hydrolase [Bacteroidetes bacterium]|nr:alpha/beta fold hydrolase [Bacteroidota bacterium]
MPILSSSYTKPPFLYLNGHFETILPSIGRRIEGVCYEREKIDTPDGDFLNLDWSRVAGERLLIVSHGLEGDSQRHYARALVKLFNQQGIDVLVWNNRSCGGDLNLQPVLYHHGSSQDLDTVIQHVLSLARYAELYLAGISMGGAQTLNYLGKKGEDLPHILKKAAVYSTPVHLPSSAATLRRTANRFYQQKFLGKLKKKMEAKGKQYPGLIDLERLPHVRDFDEFDTHYTAKLHGFANAADFYEQASPHTRLKGIRVPTLILNALNDPLLGQECNPVAFAQGSTEIFLEMPKRGGHTGFTIPGSEFNYAEYRLLEFLTQG